MLLAVVLASAAVAQQPVLLVTPPQRLYESDVQSDFIVAGRNIENDYPDLTVLLDDVDVTSQVSWTWADEKRVDVNSDGWLESFVATAELNVSNLTLTHASVLEVEAETDGALGAPVQFRSGVRTMGHSVVKLAPSRLDHEDLPEELCVFLRMWGVPSTGVTHSVKIRKNGIDITPSGVFVENVLGTRDVGGGLVDWVAELTITTSSLGTIVSGTLLEVEMTVNVPGQGSFTSSAGYLIDDGAEQVPCLDEALCEFVTALGITQTGPGSQLSIATTDKDSMRAAAEDLKATLRACQAAGESTDEFVHAGVVDCGDGNLVDLCIALGGDGTSSAPHARPTSIGDDDAQDKLIIALGGCAAAGSDASGGSAEAHGGDGSVVIAVGGKGSGKGYGGRADSVMGGNGQAYALGGRGGEGAGQGGNGFTDCAPGGTGGGGQGVAGGGPGGHSGDGSEGGHGGGAGVRTTTGHVEDEPGGPKGGGKGGTDLHGSGACAVADPMGNGNADKGTSVDNE